MTLDEARELLELGADADGRAIRRAYLRAVKRHSPERDPEGFARVREAFELCRVHVAWTPPLASEGAELEASAPAPFVEAASPPLRAEVAAAVASRDPESTLRLFEQAFEVCEGEGEAVWAPLVLDVILGLEAEERPDEAVRLARRLERHVACMGTWYGGPIAARWALIMEFAELGDEFPRSIRAALARAILAGECTTQQKRSAELRSLAEHDVANARYALMLLRRDGPNLGAVYAELIDDVLVGSKVDIRHAVMLAVFVLLAIGAVIRHGPHAAQPARPMLMAPVVHRVSLGDLALITVRACARSPRLCHAMERLVFDVEWEDCANARDALTELRSDASEYDRVLPSNWNDLTLQQAVDDVCAGVPP
ncbi:MAG: J domain-containing protein [Deltaproteobacteria bacterium]|nr:J domain-containing protein [Deltaproteobacteria bacterium]